MVDISRKADFSENFSKGHIYHRQEGLLEEVVFEGTNRN